MMSIYILKVFFASLQFMTNEDLTSMKGFQSFGYKIFRVFYWKAAFFQTINYNNSNDTDDGNYRKLLISFFEIVNWAIFAKWSYI